MRDLLTEILSTPPEPVSHTLDSWRSWFVRQPEADPFQLAVRCGFAADRLGWAFAGGYQAAGRQLLGPLGGGLFALCATEATGGHPRAIQTRLEGGRLTGEKTFVTMGPAATVLVVIATTGEGPGGRPALKAAVVSPETAGVTVTEGRRLPFVSEVPHGGLLLEGAEPVRLLEGDGYTDHLKPFRTIEDVHVNAALLGHLVQVGRRNGWPAEVIESLLVMLCALQPIAAVPKSVAGHRVLGGVLAQLSALLERDLPMEPEVAARWQRDRALLQLAAKARQARLQKARG